MSKIRIILFSLCIVLIAVGSVLLWTVYRGYREGQELYRELRNSVVQADEEREEDDKENNGDSHQKEIPGFYETETEDGGSDDEVDAGLPEDAPPKHFIDFIVLLARNSDVVGWIELPALNLSYPILQGKDNGTYLHTSLDREYLFAGSIFLDASCSKRFQDYNSIIYGHNMRDKTMFARLHEYGNKDIYDSCPYFWIYTPQKNLLYRICSVHPSDVSGSTYMIRFSTADEHEEWLRKMNKMSVISTGWNYSPDDRIVTLSTCTSDRGARYTVQGQLIWKSEQEYVDGINP